jgi:quercetin dioxygenase-like cupin family protein
MKWLLCTLFAFGTGCSLAGEETTPNDVIVTSAQDIPWASSEDFNATRWKDILGGDGDGQIPQEDIRFGLVQLAPNAVYPGHRHEAPEVYYVLSGKASWTVGSQSFIAEAGATIYIPANTIHRMVNQLDEPLTAVWAWWAPGGDKSVFDRDAYEFTEDIPDQSDVGFDDGESGQ